MNEPTEPKPSHASVYAALAVAQSQMGKALKDANNPHFKSKYADLSNVTDAALPALNANGIAVFQPMRSIDGKDHVVTIFAHSSGDCIECAVPLLVNKNDMQGLGSAITYARRYGLMMMAGIAPEDDDGNAAAKSPPVVDSNQLFEADVAAALKSISRETSLESLGEYWVDLAKNSKAIATDARVIAAKDKRKVDLRLADTADSISRSNDDMGGDFIPHQGAA